ncbi:MAG: hypothetical protein IJ038_04780 [Clostridia bacterium]|nr:hypothetical protein [Clostridia bacterium]
MNIFKKAQSLHIKEALSTISKYSGRILNIGLPTVLFYFSVILSDMLSSGLPGYILAKTYFNALEHILMSTTLIILGAVLIDFLDRRKRNGTL